MPRKPVVCVRGVPGSGKSWIARALAAVPGVRCIDTDDFHHRAYDTLRATVAGTRKIAAHAGKPLPSLERAKARLLRAEVKAFQAGSGRVLVIVGVTIPPPPGAAVYFIALDDLPAVYLRYVRREAEKVAESVAATRRRIAALRPVAPDDLRCLSMDLSFIDVRVSHGWPPPSFDSYNAEYRGALRAETARGARVLSQAQIVAEISAAARDK